MSHPHLTGWPSSCPKSPYLRRLPKTRTDLRKTSGYSPKTGQRNSLSGHGPGWPFNVLFNKAGLFYGETFVLIFSGSQDVTQSRPRTAPLSLCFSPLCRSMEITFLCLCPVQGTHLKLVFLYAKIHPLIPWLLEKCTQETI